MKKIYTLLLCVLCAFATSAYGQMRVKGDITYYDGEVSISMNDVPITTGKAVSISLEEGDASNVYELVLADFVLEMGTETLDVGDIVVPNVTFTDDNGDGNIEVTGSVDHITLAQSFPEEQWIHASVDISGTRLYDGTMTLTIDVTWYMAWPITDSSTMPISVSFTGKERENGGVAGLDSDAVSVYGVAGAVKVDGFSGVAEVYSVDGRLVKAQTVGDGSQIDLASGLYIVRAAGKSVKVAVR
jgi:hypothetical protein